MVELLFASHNLGKITEVQFLLAGLPIRVISPEELSIPADFEVAETGSTFQANAELKARGFAAAIQKFAPHHWVNTWVVADDSGIAIDALQGQPGVHSKRFVVGTDQGRNQAILEKLQTKLQPEQRTAQFVAVWCLYQPQQDQVTFFEGIVPGRVALHEQGTAGFGYDPIFIPQGYQQTFAELGIGVKNQHSHRALAAQQLRQFLEEKLHA